MDITKTTIYVAPANPVGRKLLEDLKQQGFNVSGLMDNIKVGDAIFHPSKAIKDCCVVVARGSFQRIVSEQLIKNGLNLKQIKNISTEGEIKQYKRCPMLAVKNIARNIFTVMVKLLRLIPYRNRRVYYAESFVDSNVLVAYEKNLTSTTTGKKPVLIVDVAKAALPELNAISFEKQPIIAFFYMLFARSFIIDHEYQSLVFSALRGQVPVIQLWHGLPYKHLSGNSHYPDINDACFISSSNWFNEHIFRKIFNSKQFLGLGYPRNDVFFQKQEERCWVNSEPLARLQDMVNCTGEFIIYAPTYRDSQDNDYPIDLDAINIWCEEHHYSFILKYHPFIYRSITESMGISATNELMQLPEFEHIYIFPNGKNVYPWLADAAMLITDYSSIAFDFMLSGKPIIYYQYDKQEYETMRGKPIIGDDIFIKGPVAADFNGLLVAMTNALQVVNTSTYTQENFRVNDQVGACTENIFLQLELIEKECRNRVPT